MDERKVFVLDDDPTGTQTVSDVEVILKPGVEAYRAFLRSGRPAVFVLTNTRAMPEAEAIGLIRRIKEDIERTAAEEGFRAAFVLRGDSTLRGHVFPEMDVFLPEGGVGLFVPAFPECGRMTIRGVHYLVEGDSRRPVSETEFARDTTFGYRSLTLADWVEERGGKHGWTGESLPLAILRSEGSRAVNEALLAAKPRTVLLPDAENEGDIALIVEGLLAAEREGANVVVRGASTLAKVRCGLRDREVRTAGLTPGSRVLVVCGSHTAASTSQLNRLTEWTGAEPIVVPVDRLFAGETKARAFIEQLSNRVAEMMHGKRFAILASERVRASERGSLADGSVVMDALVSIVSSVADSCDGVISKGGITSAQIASDGIGAASAYVEGQWETGVSAWRLRAPGGRELPYAVVPGNVGNEWTLLEVARRFGIIQSQEE